MAIYTETPVLDFVEIPIKTLSLITKKAEEDCTSKMIDLVEDFNLDDYEIQHELVMRITIVKHIDA